MNEALMFLTKDTDTNPEDWDQTETDHSSVGDEYWFKNRKTGAEAYICIQDGKIISYNLF